MSKDRHHPKWHWKSVCSGTLTFFQIILKHKFSSAYHCIYTPLCCKKNPDNGKILHFLVELWQESKGRSRIALSWNSLLRQYFKVCTFLFPSSFFAATIAFEYLLQITEDTIKQIVFFTRWATYTYENLTSS